MSPGNTNTGAVLESTVIPALRANGYKFAAQHEIGAKVGGGKHRVDVWAESPNAVELLISIKWQQVSGTAEQKVPYEVIKLIHAVKSSGGRFPYAYLVLGGPGWSTLKDFYLHDGLREYIRDYELVRIVSLDQFIALANKKAL